MPANDRPDSRANDRPLTPAGSPPERPANDRPSPPPNDRPERQSNDRPQIQGALLAQAISLGPFGFIVLDDAGQVLGANPAICSPLGYGERELEGRALTELLHLEDRAACEAGLDLVLSGRSNHFRDQVRFVDRDGKEVQAELSVRPLGRELSAHPPIRRELARPLLRHELGARSVGRRELGVPAVGRSELAAVRAVAVIDLDPGQGIATADLDDAQRIAPPEPDPDRSNGSVDLDAVLETVAELGGASAGLVAWELSVPEQAIIAAWSLAIRRRLLQRARFDQPNDEWLYDLTPIGRAWLRCHGARSGGGAGPNRSLGRPRGAS
jgi:PAS domain S-box-containing protein